MRITWLLVPTFWACSLAGRAAPTATDHVTPSPPHSVQPSPPPGRVEYGGRQADASPGVSPAGITKASGACGDQSCDTANLEQYTRAASAAWYQVVVGAVTLVVSVIGLVFLVRTFGETRKTTRAANDSAHEAKRSADAAQASLQATLRTERPYLLINIDEAASVVELVRNFIYTAEAIGQYGQPELQATIAFKNYGRQPAIVDSIFAHLVAYQGPPPLGFLDDLLVPRGSVVAPGEASLKQIIGPQDELTNRIIEAMRRNQKLSLWLYGKVIYRGVPSDGEPYETEFLYCFDRDRGGFDPYSQRELVSRNLAK